jgi:hypothetical protein
MFAIAIPFEEQFPFNRKNHLLTTTFLVDVILGWQGICAT